MCQDVTVACAAALQDLARLGRWMAGKAVGLVLSGGGSRGLAHLGVLHALDDAGVPVDIIGGTSQVSMQLAAAQKPRLKDYMPQGAFTTAACAFRSNPLPC